MVKTHIWQCGQIKSFDPLSDNTDISKLQISIVSIVRAALTTETKHIKNLQQQFKTGSSWQGQTCIYFSF